MAGIVTLEDLVEEIVGELDDELDTTSVDIETVDEHTTIVEGSVRVEDLNHELDLELPEGGYETVAGLLLERLGRVPQEGEQVQIDIVGLTVLEMQGPRIARVKILRR
jgi:putative hemolysin